VPSNWSRSELSLDRRLEHWVVDHRLHGLDSISVWLSRIGNNGIVWIALAAGVAIWQRRASPFVLVIVADALGQLESTLGKALIPRDRPHDNPLIQVPATHSFPSGHAASSFAAATVLAAFAPRLRVAFFLLAAAIAWSRVYNGVHWPSDVLGGAVLGVATGLLLLLGDRRLQRRSQQRD
jgi:undecaprenyl-diphosphatase